MAQSQIKLSMPNWAQAEIKKLPASMKTLEERMSAVIYFSQLNFEHNTGGPFAAGVFERDSGKLLTIGVNRVVPECCSSAHAEIMALSMAQYLLATYDLGGVNQPAHQLVVNCQPCVMCYGAILWSGVRSLVFAVSAQEVESLTGFDEGPLHPNWIYELNKRGIDVIQDVLKTEAISALRVFHKNGGFVYNSRQDDAK